MRYIFTAVFALLPFMAIAAFLMKVVPQRRAARRERIMREARMHFPPFRRRRLR